MRGETHVGLFALRDIKKGEELTFDYQVTLFVIFYYALHLHRFTIFVV